MTDLDALNKVWTMAYHAKDLKGVPWTDEEKDALETVRRFIEANYPLRNIRRPNYIPIGGAGNGA
jgi:ubiquinone biosynthesis protein Coq4